MPDLIIIEEDVVSNTGKDKHSIIGTNNNSGAPVVALFSYDFSGKVKEKNSGNNFVTISKKKIITKGNNECPQIQNHVATDVTVAEATAYESWAKANSLTGFGFAPPVIDEPDNNGENSSDAGSSFIKISGSPVILNGDNFDTCHSDGITNKGRSTTSTATATGQDFVTVSE